MSRSDWIFMIVAATWVVAAIVSAPRIRPVNLETPAGQSVRCAHDTDGAYRCSPDR
jgi:hypothetical protein